METKAFIFDLNGTMVDDMHYHAQAWYDILNNDLKAGLTWDEVKVQMYGKNAEVLERIFGENHFTDDQIKELSLEKERRYQQAYLPHLSLIKGLQVFLEKAEKDKIPMAIGSAAISFNISFVLDNLNIRHFFKAIVSADDVATSKPDPKTFIECARLLNIAPENCIVFEDAPKGIEAAQNAGMQAFVLTTMYPKDEFVSYKNIIGFSENYASLSPFDFIYENEKVLNNNLSVKPTLI
ncbi:MAG TPA: HAD family phosphatase [Hanamia sp.]|nr:HAD family phosphatase [Hanamia sp.]